jgi:membrane protein
VTVTRTDPVELARATLAVANERNVRVTAASVAFYAFNAVIPLALLVFVAFTVVGGPDVVQRAVALVVGGDPGRVGAIVDRVSDDPPGRTRAVVVATGVLTWSAFRLFQAVNGAFADVYGTRKRTSIVEAVVDTLVVLVTVPVAIVVVAFVGATVSLRADALADASTAVGVGAGVVDRAVALAPYGSVLLFAVLLVSFLPMYYVFPDVEVSVGEALPGAVLAAGGWTASAAAFRLYLDVSPNPYGLAGAVLLLLSWLYVGGLLLLFGVVVNAVLGRRVTADDDWLPGG